MSSAATAPLPSPPPPAAPRPVTLAVRRRALMEPGVRVWWIFGLVLTGIAVGMAVKGVVTWNRARWLVHNGWSVNAAIDLIDTYESGLRQNASPDNLVRLHIINDAKAKGLNLNGADQPMALEGYLDGRTATISLYTVVPEEIPIIVDPGDPYVWTYRTETPPLLNQLGGAGLVFLLALPGFIAAYIGRNRLLGIWAKGVAEEYAVVSSHQTAIAPMSRIVHCTPLSGGLKRPIKVFVPMRLADPLPGQVLWLIHPPGKPTVAIPAIAYGS